MSIFKACDIRGEFGSELHISHATQLGTALRGLQGPVAVLVAGDARVSTPALKSALIDSLLRSGCDVVDLGAVLTPLFYFARLRLGIQTGVMVTASHNPAADNGFKVTLGSLPVTQAEMDRLAGSMDSQSAPTGPPSGKSTRIDLLPDYLSFLAGHSPDLSGLKVVVDCANGMAGLVARKAWQKTGAEVSYLLEEVDGRFPAHAPNPAEMKNLAQLRQAVREQGAALGVAYDGDGDRVAFVDENGEALVNDKVIVLFAREMLRYGPETIVYDQKCSRIVPDAIRDLGGSPVMELSGHTYIKRAFLERKAAYAGELSGHHFVRAFSGDDAPAASMLFARILKDSRVSLAQLAAQIPSYPITPDLRIPMRADEVQRVLSELEANLDERAAVSRTDGLRIEFADGWALVRPSVTEPVLTLRCEGIHESALHGILEQLRTASPLLSRLGENKLRSTLAH